MRKILALITITALAGLLVWMNHDKLLPVTGPAIGRQPSAAPSVTPAGPTETQQQRVRGMLIDPTNSTDSSFRESMKAHIIGAVQTYVPPKPPDTKPGVPPVIGLQLTVRLVATNSLAYGQQNVEISIPNVPALPARPDMTLPGALNPGGPYDTWKQEEGAWSSAYDTAIAEAASAVQALGALNLEVNEASGITAGAAALALLAPPRGDVGFAVLSDLDENRPQQPANFYGHPILVVQPDPVGDIGQWDSLFNNFSSWASASGAGTITRVRPEAGASAITSFITGK